MKIRTTLQIFFEFPHEKRQKSEIICLSNRFIQITSEEKGLGGEEETGDTRGIDHHDRPEGGGIAQELGNHTSHKNAEAHTDVPGDEDGGVGSTPLAVAGHIDGHVLEGGPHVTVSQADEQGRAVIADNH